MSKDDEVTCDEARDAVASVLMSSSRANMLRRFIDQAESWRSAALEQALTLIGKHQVLEQLKAENARLRASCERALLWHEQGGGFNTVGELREELDK